MPVIGGTRQTLCRDARTFDSPRRLAELEEVPANGLLRPHGVVAVSDNDIGAIPEPVQVRGLVIDKAAERLRDRTVESSLTACCEVTRWDTARRLVRHILDDANGFTGLCLGRQHHLGEIVIR